MKLDTAWNTVKQPLHKCECFGLFNQIFPVSYLLYVNKWCRAYHTNICCYDWKYTQFLINVVQDRHAGGNSMPVVDQQQNYKLLSLTESDGKTVMKFQRSIEACDENDLTITVSPGTTFPFIQQGHIQLIKSDSKDIYNVTKYFYFK